MLKETPTPVSKVSKRSARGGNEELDMDIMLKKRASDEVQERIELEEIDRDELVRRRKKNPLFQGCNTIENYIYLNKIHEGSYGVVFRAQDAISGHIYAIKNIKIENDSMG
jgi:serine/threonine protein kinase